MIYTYFEPHVKKIEVPSLPPSTEDSILRDPKTVVGKLFLLGDVASFYSSKIMPELDNGSIACDEGIVAFPEKHCFPDPLDIPKTWCYALRLS